MSTFAPDPACPACRVRLSRPGLRFCVECLPDSVVEAILSAKPGEGVAIPSSLNQVPVNEWLRDTRAINQRKAIYDQSGFPL